MMRWGGGVESEFLFSGIAYMNRAWLLQYKIFETAKQFNIDGKIQFFWGISKAAL